MSFQGAEFYKNCASGLPRDSGQSTRHQVLPQSQNAVRERS